MIVEVLIFQSNSPHERSIYGILIIKFHRLNNSTKNVAQELKAQVQDGSDMTHLPDLLCFYLMGYLCFLMGHVCLGQSPKEAQNMQKPKNPIS